MHRYLLLKSILFSIFAIFCSAALSAQNSSLEQPSAETLAMINKAITDVQNEIARRNSERASAYQLLESTEKEMLSLTNEISLIEADIRQNTSEVEKLQAQRNDLLLKKDSQQDLIGNIYAAPTNPVRKNISNYCLIRKTRYCFHERFAIINISMRHAVKR